MQKESRKNAEELITKLQLRKGDILKQQQQARKQMRSFFKEMKESLQIYEEEIAKKINQQVLNYHQTVSSTVKILSKLKNHSSEDTFSNAIQIVNSSIYHGSKVDQSKLKELLHEVYYIKLGRMHEEEKIDVPEFSQSRSITHEKVYRESEIEKLQQERDYYERRQQELKHRIRQLQNVKKGVNIRQLSKSALEDKCSKWAVERLREQNRILVQRIGQASKQIMKQDAFISQMQEQNRKLNSVLNDSHCKSMINGSQIKNASVLIENQKNYEKSMQLENKNTELAFQLTNIIKRLEEMYEANKQLEGDIESSKRENDSQRFTITQLEDKIELMNQEYENSIHRKAVIEQQYKQLQRANEDICAKLQQQREVTKNIVEGFEMSSKEINQKLKHIQKQKKSQISAMQQKLSQANYEREKLLKRIDEIGGKTGQQITAKQVLNQQIARLIRQNGNLQKQINSKQQQLFQSNQELNKHQFQAKQLLKRTQTSKKQALQSKKAMKQMQKRYNELIMKLNSIEQTQNKINILEQQLYLLQAQFSKCRQFSQRKTSIHDKMISTMKQRFSLQLAHILTDDTKKLKKDKVSKSEMIQKYIEEMIVFSTKTAQIKQLKEQLREAREQRQAKQLKQTKKKMKSSLALEESLMGLENNMLAINARIFEERLKNQKTIFEERIKEAFQMQKKEETAKNCLKQQLENQRATTAQFKAKIKLQKPSDDSSKILKQLQQKNEKAQQEIKRFRAKVKKLENDLNEAQSQLKTKRDLTIGLKNAVKSKQQKISQQQKDIDTLRLDLQRISKNNRQVASKEEHLRQFRQQYKGLKEIKQQLLQTIEEQDDKIKQLQRQLSKKEQVIKQLSNIQEKQSKRKEDLLVKSLNSEIIELKEAVRKLRMDNDRKDDIIKNTKNKIENKNKENEEIMMRGEKQLEKVSKQREIFERKLESTSMNLKREQMKVGNLSCAIKKIYQLCCQTDVKRQTQTKAKPQSTQYYSNSEVTPNTMKLGTPGSNFKSFSALQGLQILNLRPEDLQQCLALQATINRSDIGHESWTMTSPAAKRQKISDGRQLIDGLQEIERTLNAKQINVATLMQHFKRILQN